VRSERRVAGGARRGERGVAGYNFRRGGGVVTGRTCGRVLWARREWMRAGLSSSVTVRRALPALSLAQRVRLRGVAVAKARSVDVGGVCRGHRGHTFVLVYRSPTLAGSWTWRKHASYSPQGAATLACSPRPAATPLPRLKGQRGSTRWRAPSECRSTRHNGPHECGHYERWHSACELLRARRIRRASPL